MTVASMPMWSPVTRSPPLAEIATPRKRLPPPMTTAISVPARATSAISPAKRVSAVSSMPNGRLPSSASPESLRRTRLGLGLGGMTDLAPSAANGAAPSA